MTPRTRGLPGLALALLAAAPCLAQVGSAAAPPAAATTPDSVTFDEAVALATERSPGVAEAAQAILRAEALLARARTVFWPQAYGNVGTTVLDDARGFDGNVVTPRTQTAFGATVSYALLDAARWANKSAAGDNVEVARASAHEVRQHVAVVAAQAYFGVIASERQREIAVRNRDTAQALEEYARARLEAGQGSRLNHVRSLQQRASADGLVELAEFAVSRAREALGVAVFASHPVGARGEPALPVAPPPSNDAWLAQRPDVALSTKQLEAWDRVVSDAWKSWLPTATAAFSPRYVTPAGLFEPSKSWRALFALQIPIFDGTLGADKRLKVAERDSARIRLDALELEARSELRVAQDAVLRVDRLVAASREASQNALEALRITEIAYRAGATTNIEVVQAQQTARNAEIETAVAEDRLRQARLDLLVALGQFP